MPQGSGFHLSRIVVVESLEPHERRTGEELTDFINQLVDAAAAGVRAEYRVCDNALEFKALVSSLAAEARQTGSVPILHVECHGGKNIGLEFRNSSVLSWDELSLTLLELNVATRFNLVAAFSACYGAHFLSQLDSVNPSPCYAMIAPTDSVFVYELLAGFKVFYSTFFSNRDAGTAVDALTQVDLSEGSWYSTLSEFWFERVIVGYIETHCTTQEMKQRALRMRRELQSRGVTMDLGKLKRNLALLNREQLTGKFFDKFFMTDSIPENRIRFLPVRDRVTLKIAELRKSGRYGI
jgi:hypothetical protein